MKKTLRYLGLFLLAFFLGTSYAVMIGVLSAKLRTVLIAWPIQIICFWILLGKFKLHRFVAFILVPPVLLLGFQLYWTAGHPGLVADKYVAYDRSHYVPGTRVKAEAYNQTDPDASGWNVAETLIGADGFRADPATGRGNPQSCQHVLIGDSMVYGSGLVYANTLGPVLREMGVQACVFGVTGNSPADYLSTLNYVKERITPGADIAFYIYAYNDFVSISKYLTRRIRGYSGRFPLIAECTYRFDQWRRSTITYAWFNAPRSHPSMKQWQYPVGGGKQIKLLYPGDPLNYDRPRPLDNKQREALMLFFSGVADSARGRHWRIAMIIHPDQSEVYANLARGTRVWEDLDPRRGEALEMCRTADFVCEDISRFIYEKAIAEGKNPFFTDDRHFSRFGTHIVAENFIAFVKRVGGAVMKKESEHL